MHRTPWTKQNSSLPSDRIKPVVKAPTGGGGKGKGKGTQTPPEPPKSRAVRKLEKLLSEIKSASGAESDPQGGCFCLARRHDLSPYIPMCQSCGFILCDVNHPRYSCPSCQTNLLSSSRVKQTIMSQIESELGATLAMELEEKEKALEEAQKAAGAFPQLLASSSSSMAQPTPAPPPQPQTHKVLSLQSTGKKSRRVIVSSYTTTPPPQSRPDSRNSNDLADEPVDRVPHPLLEPIHSPNPPKSQSRPWENLIHGAVSYKPQPRLDDDASKGPSTSRRRRKAKGKENESAS
ncbi:hypothetical protein CPC08DRAFT_712457 [Agrocybe pediades]|nr:hypothetical protein CPC08DRAFT_712457 [Agrocybe pediades]